jgi:hypothetical protein
LFLNNSNNFSTSAKIWLCFPATFTLSNYSFSCFNNLCAQSSLVSGPWCTSMLVLYNNTIIYWTLPNGAFRSQLIFTKIYKIY